MTTALAKKADFEIIEQVLVTGNLGQLSAEQRVLYYNRLCKSLGVDPYSRPFEYIVLNGKLTLYAKRDCTDQLRAKRGVSIEIKTRELLGEDTYVVTAHAKLPDGREDESIGAVPIAGLKGEARANALMKCETKAKRRVTLSICGLGLLDETEVAAIPTHATTNTIALEPRADDAGTPEPHLVPVDVETGEEKPAPPAGFHYIRNYRRHGQWHEFDLLDADAQHGTMRLSTKKAIGFVAEQAQADGVPVRVTTSPKRNGSPGEAYLDTIHKLEIPDTLKPFAKAPLPDAPDVCPRCGLALADCAGHDSDEDDSIPF